MAQCGAWGPDSASVWGKRGLLLRLDHGLGQAFDVNGIQHASMTCTCLRLWLWLVWHLHLLGHARSRSLGDKQPNHLPACR